MITYKALLEATKDHHTSVVPLVGFSPFSHEGHHIDLGSTLETLPGRKVVGMSSKPSDAFSAEERGSILQRQWGKSVNVHHGKSGGETVATAFHGLPAGRRHLHILVGADRRDFAEGLKKSLEAGKIPEMKGGRFHSITIHYPDDAERSHGMSGTKMRQAALDGNVKEFHRHLGGNFTRKEAHGLMTRTAEAINSGKLKVKR